MSTTTSDGMSATTDSSTELDSSPLDFFTNSTGDAAIDADLAYILSIDWSKSSIGPVASWPPELLTLINLAMLSPQPQLFLLGPDSIILYNTAYGRLLRDHHPLYQGRPIALDTALIAQAPAINRIVDRAKTRTQPANENQVVFFFLSHGKLEEVFLSATMVKLPRSLGGFHATTYDTTAEAVQSRRNHTLESVLEHARTAKTLSTLWLSISKALEEASDEIAFAVFYCANTSLERDVQSDAVHRKVDSHKFYLAGEVGDFAVPLANQVDLDDDEKWIAAMRRAATLRTAVLLKTDDGTLPENLAHASCNRCHLDDCREAVILPSSLDEGADVHGLLIIGLAPRRPYDYAYQYWIQTLNRSIANLVASININEARALARENEEKRAARERDTLAKELSLKQQEAALAAGKIQRMLGIMESANVGVFECLPNGQLIQTNESFARLCNHSQSVRGNDRQNILSLFESDGGTSLEQHLGVLLSGKPLTFIMRSQIDGQQEDKAIRWLQAACLPVLNSASTVESVTGCVVDITAQKRVQHEAVKRAEALEKLRQNEARVLQETIEAKRQQENFIDMTSHEIRNPLGVVLHCVDAMSQTLSEMKVILDHTRQNGGLSQGLETDVERLHEFRRELSEVVVTIMSCTMHQKRITDDILTLSKLDSDLLEISPSVFEVESFLRQVHNTFAAEAARAEVTLETVYDPSMTAMNVHWVKADPGRLMQVLVNLIANAIKFTKGQDGSRVVTVHVGACRTLSTNILEELVVAGKKQSATDSHTDATDDAIYLWFKIQDTGCGMDAVGRTKIFSRFSQASPKTYNSYGGSGLGLFISKKLVSLQGGEIGFTAEQDSGSTFAFYVQATRAMSPDHLGTSTPQGSLPPTPNEGPTDSVSSRPSKRTILLVEDNLINQKVLKKQLVRTGFTVHTADNGQHAYDFIMTTRHWTRSAENDPVRPVIDVILMDIEMPIMNGLECASLIRSAEKKGDLDKRLPIIAVTANARPEQLRQAIEIGMDDAISKPFRVQDLKPLIQRLAPGVDEVR